jgi:GT2 family glycosyltransferase
VVAFNSAACISTQAIGAIGGFPEEYWLDYLDHIVFYRLQTAGGHVYVLNSQLQHHLSLQNMEVSMQRYSNVLASEWRYVQDSRSGSLLHRVRLLKRTISHFVKLKNKAYARLTLQYALTGNRGKA